MHEIEALVYELSAPRNLYLKKEIINTSSLQPNELVAKTCYTAISPGTELGAYCGMEPLRADVSPYPRVVGYCNVAQVIHKGSAVSKFQVGDYFLNFQSHRSYFKCRENDFLLPLPVANVKSYTVAYLYHLGYHSLLTADVKMGHNVCIIGLGTLGFTTSILSRAGGASTYVLSNQPIDKKVFLSKNIEVLKKEVGSLEIINKKTHQTGIDVVINTSNRWEDWLLAMNAVNKGGTIVNLGFPGREQPAPNFNPLDPKFLYMKSITIKYLSALNRSGLAAHEQRFNIERNLNYIIDLINNNSINPTEIISSEISYKDLEVQYQKYESKKHNLFSTLLTW